LDQDFEFGFEQESGFGCLKKFTSQFFFHHYDFLMQFCFEKNDSFFFSLLLNDFFGLDFLLDFILAHTSKLLFCKSLLSFVFWQ